MPHAIRIDRGTEFVNTQLTTWCMHKGINIQKTTPYSPLQNGIAEHMNHTLVELARAMLIAAKLPKFLWEPAIEHSVYLCNYAFTSTIMTTPYQ
jgi:transposase InsO family protein